MNIAKLTFIIVAYNASDCKKLTKKYTKLSFDIIELSLPNKTYKPAQKKPANIFVTIPAIEVKKMPFL